MAERIGTCAGCGARFKIPPTFQKATAKCKKCGGVVKIEGAGAPKGTAPAQHAPAVKKAAGPAAGPGKPARTSARPAPSAAPGLRSSARARGADAAASAARGSSSARTRGGAGGRSSARGRGGREQAPKKNNMMLFAVLGGVLVIGGGFGVFMAMSGDDDPTTPIASAAGNDGKGSAVTPVDDKPAAPVADPGVAAANKPAAPAEVPTPAAESGAASSDDGSAGTNEAASTPEPAPEQPQEAIKTLFEFELFSRMPGTTDEEWDEIQIATDSMTMGGKRRKDFMKQLVPFGAKAVPAVINSLNGTDLTDSTSWRDSWEVAVFLQDDLTGGVIKIPMHGDFSTDRAEIKHNSDCLQSLLNYWSGIADDEDRLSSLATKIAEARGE